MFFLALAAKTGRAVGAEYRAAVDTAKRSHIPRLLSDIRQLPFPGRRGEHIAVARLRSLTATPPSKQGPAARLIHRGDQVPFRYAFGSQI